jgi:glucuronokinase
MPLRSPMAEARVQARAALAGNPSDGYGGSVVAVPIAGLAATVVSEPARDVSFDVAGQGSRAFGSLAEALGTAPVCDGPGLMHAALRRAIGAGIEIKRGIALYATTTIPTEVGLASSSALVIAAMRALEIRLDADELARCALATETEDLGVAAGLQDRLVQTYGVPLHMDFASGISKPMTGTLPELLLAWRPDAATSSGLLHGDLRLRFDRGDKDVVDAMPQLARHADRARDAIGANDLPALAAAMNGSFDIREAIGASDPTTSAMVQTARATGAAANSAGSGGAVVCLPTDVESTERDLKAAGYLTQRLSG